MCKLLKCINLKFYIGVYFFNSNMSRQNHDDSDHHTLDVKYILENSETELSGTNGEEVVIKAEEVKETKPLQCSFCGKAFTLRKNCLRHEKCCTANNDPDISSNIFCCHFCGFTMKRKDNFQAHVKKCEIKLKRSIWKHSGEGSYDDFSKRRNTNEKEEGSHSNDEELLLYPKKPCKYCSKEVTKPNLQRHQMYCFKNPHVAAKSVICENCGKLFKRLDNMKAHAKKCLDPPQYVRKEKIPCLYPSCTEKFFWKTLLIEHVKNSHDASIIADPVTKTFECVATFTSWKEAEEERTSSYFSQKCGLNPKSKTRYFYCQHDGSAKPHRKQGQEARKTNRRFSRGRVKVGNHCISSMKVTYLDSGSVNVLYYPTHNHPLKPEDLRHHPLSSRTYEYIDEQIALCVSPSTIQRDLRTKALSCSPDVPVTRDYFVSKKLIKERARKRKNAICNANRDTDIHEEVGVTVDSKEDHVFPESEIPPVVNDIDERERTFRETRRQRIEDNLNKVLSLVRANEMPDHLLNKLDANVAELLQHTDAFSAFNSIFNGNI